MAMHILLCEEEGGRAGRVGSKGLYQWTGPEINGLKSLDMTLGELALAVLLT